MKQPKKHKPGTVELYFCTMYGSTNLLIVDESGCEHFMYSFGDWHERRESFWRFEIYSKTTIGKGWEFGGCI